MELLNRAQIIGRMTKDPEIRKTQSGKTIATFTLAADRHGDSDKADFINFVAWEKTADIVERFGRKGLLVYAEGRIEVDTYDGADGSKRTIQRVNTGRFVALEKQDRTSHAGLQPQAGAGQERFTDDMWSRAAEDSMNIDPDNLPF